MKKINILILFIMLFTLVSCNNKQEEKQDFVVGLECNYTPFNWTETKRTKTNYPIYSSSGLFAEGYDVQMAKLIAEKLNLHLVIKKVSWDGLIPALDTGTIDAIIAGMSPTDERKLSIDFTDAYYLTKHVILTTKDSKYAGKTTFEELKGCKSVGQKGTNYDDLALQVVKKAGGGTHQTALTSVPLIIESIKSGKSDLTVLELPVAKGLVEKDPSLTYFKLNEEFDLDDADKMVSIGLSKTNTDLKLKINKALNEISEEQREKIMDTAVNNQSNAVDADNIKSSGWIIFKNVISNYGFEILKGVGVTLLLSLVGTILGLVIALFLGTILSLEDNPFDSKFQKNLKKFLKFLINIYTTVFRGTPMLVQAVIFFYSFSKIGINWSPLMAGCFTVTINTGAYLTEVVRSGITSISKDQTEAGLSVGLSPFKTFFFIRLPQSLKNSMASIGNELIVNIKDTSVLSVIMVVDLYYICTDAASTYGNFTIPMLIAAGIYLCLTLFFSTTLKAIEKRLGAPTKTLTSCN